MKHRKTANLCRLFLGLDLGEISHIRHWQATIQHSVNLTHLTMHNSMILDRQNSPRRLCNHLLRMGLKCLVGTSRHTQPNISYFAYPTHVNLAPLQKGTIPLSYDFIIFLAYLEPKPKLQLQILTLHSPQQPK